jgi:hypothetical protein
MQHSVGGGCLGGLRPLLPGIVKIWFMIVLSLRAVSLKLVRMRELRVAVCGGGGGESGKTSTSGRGRGGGGFGFGKECVKNDDFASVAGCGVDGVVGVVDCCVVWLGGGFCAVRGV